MPQALKKLDDKLVAFWDKLPFPFSPVELDHNTERGLFRVQDIIKDPRIKKSNTQDFTALVSENQGVWHFYYNDKHNLFLKEIGIRESWVAHILPHHFLQKLRMLYVSHLW